MDMFYIDRFKEFTSTIKLYIYIKKICYLLSRIRSLAAFPIDSPHCLGRLSACYQNIILFSLLILRLISIITLKTNM